jgi:hypothetical protein
MSTTIVAESVFVDLIVPSQGIEIMVLRVVLFGLPLSIEIIKHWLAPSG